MADMTAIPLGYLLRDPAERARVAERIRAALGSGGSLAAAASALGVTYRTLCRWREEWPELVPTGEPGNPNLKKLQPNHDTPVMRKPRQNSLAAKTATASERAAAPRRNRRPQKHRNSQS